MMPPHVPRFGCRTLATSGLPVAVHPIYATNPSRVHRHIVTPLSPLVLPSAHTTICAAFGFEDSGDVLALRNSNCTDQ
jgi:hypothetical protein